ncbi:hypothetical protein BXZ70DRAFT_905950 [Cristinia sonorae]|uniref:MARVEL domain-containing protein n=1 Tax=Cristinia sonorae TaxID=1940300 RepID=A0A8K0XRL8_9AGAR|nr:hypothetical protein BXZ70DRAFT_905950 [Cristinia sonorae]
MRARQRRIGFRTNYHAFLFTLMALTAAAELGLTAFLISAGSEVHIWSSPRYQPLLILLCFEATWTLVFSTAYMLWVVDGAVHLLANVAHSVFWLLLTAVLWGTGTGLMHHTRSGGYCPGRAPFSRLMPTVSNCRGLRLDGVRAMLRHARGNRGLDERWEKDVLYARLKNSGVRLWESISPVYPSFGTCSSTSGADKSEQRNEVPQTGFGSFQRCEQCASVSNGRVIKVLPAKEV